MDMPINTFKRAIREGRRQIGLWSSLSSNISVEILAGSGFDWLLIDTEHSPNDLPMVYNQLQAAVGGTAHPIVRVPWNDMVTIKRYLDAGTQTFLIPYVQNEEEARQAVASTRYPPEGGCAASRRPRGRRASVGSRTTTRGHRRRSVCWCRSKPAKR